MTPDLTRNSQLVKYFAQQYPGVPRKHLVKLIFIADILGRQYLGAPLSTLNWYRYKHGPYDEAIETAIAELVEAGLVDDKSDPWWHGPGRYKRVPDSRRPVPFDFSLGESAVLDYVVANYVNMDTTEFVNSVVKETAPYKAATRLKQRLPMEMVDNQGTADVGFKLEEVLRAEQEGRSGDYVTLSEFVDELRAKAPA